MKELANTPRRPSLRLTERCAFYDEHGSHLWREWPEGAVVTDQSEIELLEARGASFERIAIEPKEYLR